MSKERIRLRVVHGAFQPADRRAYEQLRAMQLRADDMVLAQIYKPRNPKFHRLVHQIGALCASNIDAFAGMSAHDVIKQVQLDADIECDKRRIDVPGMGAAMITTARSIAFDKMDEVQFKALARDMCRHIAETYWPDLTPEQVQEMAEAFVEEG